jgi:hypothetical protein
MDVRKPEVAALVFVRQLEVVHSETVKNGGLQIVDVDRI